MSKWYAYITYTDRFVIEAKDKSEVRKIIKENWKKYGLQYEKMRITKGEDWQKADRLEDLDPKLPVDY